MKKVRVIDDGMNLSADPCLSQAVTHDQPLGPLPTAVPLPSDLQAPFDEIMTVTQTVLDDAAAIPEVVVICRRIRATTAELQGLMRSVLGPGMAQLMQGTSQLGATRRSS